MNSCFRPWCDTRRGSQENAFQAPTVVKVQSDLLQSFGQDFRTSPSQKGESSSPQWQPTGYVVVLPQCVLSAPAGHPCALGHPLGAIPPHQKSQ